MEFSDLVLGVLGVVLGGVLKGATGAGAPIVGVPILVAIYDVPFAVAVFTFPNLLSNLWQSWQYRRHRLPPRFTWGFALAGVAGAAFGSALLVSLSADALLLGVSAAVLLYIGFRVVHPDWSLKMAVAVPLAAPAGFLGGVLQGAAGISAPVSITFLNAIRMERASFIATIAVFFAAMSLVQIPLLAFWGVLTFERTLLSLAAFLLLLAAMPIGEALARRFSARFFDRLVLALLGVIAVRLSAAALL